MSQSQREHLSALASGTRLRDYRIEQILGAGGFGITYKGREGITERAVAIKEYLPNSLAARDRNGLTVHPLSESQREDYEWGLGRFRNEAKLLIGLKHPNIVPILSYFEANGTGYLVMEFQEGKSLGQILANGATISESALLDIARPLMDGVEAVHDHSFLHRDIKPDNIFIRKNGSPVLLDFGAARQALGQQSKSLTAVLTEGYAPYEQYERDGNQGPWTDIYALGAVMFRCLLGRRPLDAPKRVAARMRGEVDPLAHDLRELSQRCAAPVASAITAALGTTEGERPQSIAEFRDRLAGRGIDVTHAPTAPGTLLPDGRAVAGVVTSASLPANGQSSPRRISPAVWAAVGLVLLGGAAAAGYVIVNGDTGPTAAERSVDAARVAAADVTRRKAEEEARAEAEAKRQAEEQARRREEERAEAEARRKSEETARKKAEEEAERKRAEEEASRRQADAEARRRAEEGKAKADAEARRKAEEEKAKADAEAGRKAEQERAAAEAEARRRAEAQKKADEEAARRREAEERRRVQQGRAEAFVAVARQRLDQARAALQQNRYSAARQLTADCQTMLKQAEDALAGLPATQALRAEHEAFERELTRRVAERVAVLLAEARQFMRSERFDLAERKLGEAEEIDAAAATVARRDLEAAKAQAEAARLRAEEQAALRRAEEEARRKAEGEKTRSDAESRRRVEEEARRKAEAAKAAAEAESRRRAEAEARRKAEEEAAARRAEEERRRIQQGRAEAFVAVARQRLDQARVALHQARYPEARRLAADCATMLKSADEAMEGLAAARSARTEYEAFGRELARRISERVAVLLRDARDAIASGRLDVAERRIEEAETLDEPSAAAARSELDGARKQVEEAQRKKREDDERKRNHADALARLAGQRLDQAKAALQQGRFGDARRLADDCAALLKEAADISNAAPTAESVGRGLEAFRRDFAARAAARVGVLLKEARDLVKAGRFAEADRRLEEAEGLEPTSAAVKAARHDYETAKRQSEETRARAEDETRKRAEQEAKRQAEAEAERKAQDEAKKKAADDRAKAETEAKRRAEEEAKRMADAEVKKRADEEAKKKVEGEAKKKAAEERAKADAEAKKKAEEDKPKAEPDARKQAQIGTSYYQLERKRGLIAFAHKKATLEPSALTALERLAASLQGQKDYKIGLVATADRSEGTAAELQTLSRARLTAIQQFLASKGITTGLRAGVGPTRGEGPEHRIISVAVEIADAEAKKKDEAKPSTSAPGTNASSAELNRRLRGAEWRGNMLLAQFGDRASRRNQMYSFIIRFNGAGRIEFIGHGMGAHTQQPFSDSASYTVSDGRVCAKFTQVEGGEPRCYSASLNDDDSVTLAGPGILGGKRYSR